MRPLRNSNVSKLWVLSALLAITLTPALAQHSAFTSQGGVVIVGLGKLAAPDKAAVATSLGVDVDQIPESLELPIGIAADACGVSAATLKPPKHRTPASCEAKKVSQGLSNLIRRRSDRARATAPGKT
jgi:hypothetical protein